VSQEDAVQTRSLRRSVGFLALFAGSLLLPGCIQIGLDSDFSNPDQIRQTLQYTIDRSSVGQVRQSGGALGATLTDREQTQLNAQRQGLQFEPIDTTDSLGARISVTMTAQQNELGAQLNQFLNAALPNANIPAGFNGTFQRDGTTYRLNLTINADQFFAPPAGPAPVPAEQVIDAFTVTARMPGELRETNGAPQPDGRIQWSVPVTGTTTITAASHVAGSAASTTLLRAGYGVGALLSALLVAGYVVMRRRAALAAA
jgi:hypothetical protein